MNTRKLTNMGILAALSVVLVAIVHFPLFPAAPFLEYDPADVPILIATFAFGPSAGLILTAIVSVIQGVTVSASSGVYGIIMHMAATCTYVLVAGCIYKSNKTRIGAVMALCCGTVAMGLVMAGANLIVTPYFMGTPVEAVKDMLIPVIIPFNIAKAGINAVITFLLYKHISRFIKVHHTEDNIPM